MEFCTSRRANVPCEIVTGGHQVVAASPQDRIVQRALQWSSTLSQRGPITHLAERRNFPFGFASQRIGGSTLPSSSTPRRSTEAPKHQCRQRQLAGTGSRDTFLSGSASFRVNIAPWRSSTRSRRPYPPRRGGWLSTDWTNFDRSGTGSDGGSISPRITLTRNSSSQLGSIRWLGRRTRTDQSTTPRGT